MAKGKILVVDDEVYIVHILDFSLGMEGYEVITDEGKRLGYVKDLEFDQDQRRVVSYIVGPGGGRGGLGLGREVPPQGPEVMIPLSEEAVVGRDLITVPARLVQAPAGTSTEERPTDRGYYGGAAGALVMPPGQFFSFSDRAPVPTPLKGYVGRAVIAGQSGGDYPLTNRGATPDTTAIRSMRYTGLIGIPGNPNNPTPPPPDSLLALSWETIPGAASYWVHIYQKRADIRVSEEAIAIAQPSPIASGKVRDLFIGTFPAPITSAGK